MQILLLILRASFPAAAGFSSLVLTRFFTQNVGTQFALHLNIFNALMSGLCVGLAIHAITKPDDWKKDIVFAVTSCLFAFVLADTLMTSIDFSLKFFTNPNWIKQLTNSLPWLGISIVSATLVTQWDKFRHGFQNLRFKKRLSSSLPVQLEPKISEKKTNKPIIRKHISKSSAKIQKPRQKAQPVKVARQDRAQLLKTPKLIPVKKKSVRKKDIKLSTQIEQHCPYCLEIVLPKDPRGIVKCPECGAWHHKDCWDVTGTCQVAHKHTL